MLLRMLIKRSTSKTITPQLYRFYAYTSYQQTMANYEERSEEFGFAPREEIRQALLDPDTQVLDVRNEMEINESGKFDHPHYATTPCAGANCPKLNENPEAIVKDKRMVIEDNG